MRAHTPQPVPTPGRKPVFPVPGSREEDTPYPTPVPRPPLHIKT